MPTMTPSNNKTQSPHESGPPPNVQVPSGVTRDSPASGMSVDPSVDTDRARQGWLRNKKRIRAKTNETLQREAPAIRKNFINGLPKININIRLRLTVQMSS